MAKQLPSRKFEFLLIPHSVNMYEEATEWISQIEFYETELSFLLKLLDKHFLRLPDMETVKGLAVFEKKIKLLAGTNLESIHKSVINHKNALGILEEAEFPQRAKVIVAAHKKVALKVAGFAQAVNETKKALFQFVEKEVRFSKAVKETNKNYEEGDRAL